MTTTTDEESSTAAALPQIQHEGIMKEDDGAQKPKDDESNIMEDNGGAVTVPLTRRVGWADGAPHVKDSTDPTEEDLQQPLSEKFEEEGSRSAAVSDEAALIHQQTTATIQIAADAAVHQHNTIGRIDKTSSLLDLPPSKATANNNIETKTTSVEDIREAIEATSLIISENMTGTVEVAVDAAADEGIHQKEEETIRQKEEETMQPKTLFEVSPAPSPSGGVIMSPSMNEETIRERTMAYEASASPEAASQLLSLPIDSLHCIASFLAPEEWANYGQTCQSANKVCREIFRRVRMHGFRCATEVITAWVSTHFNLVMI